MTLVRRLMAATVSVALLGCAAALEPARAPIEDERPGLGDHVLRLEARVSASGAGAPVRWVEVSLIPAWAPNLHGSVRAVVRSLDGRELWRGSFSTGHRSDPMSASVDLFGQISVSGLGVRPQTYGLTHDDRLALVFLGHYQTPPDRLDDDRNDYDAGRHQIGPSPPTYDVEGLVRLFDAPRDAWDRAATLEALLWLGGDAPPRSTARERQERLRADPQVRAAVEAMVSRGDPWVSTSALAVLERVE